MTKYQRNVSKDAKYLEKFLDIKYTKAKNYLRAYQKEKEGNKHE